MSKQIIWDYFKSKGFSDCGVAGLMGNIQAECSFKACNLQGTGNKKLGMTDEEYTAAVDSGAYTYEQFCKDGHGYGLAQWTYHTRKSKLYDYAKKAGASIGSLYMQLDFMFSELKGYPSVFKVLQTAETVREASDAVMLKYERPADQSEKAQLKRAGYGESVLAEFGGVKVLEEPTKEPTKAPDVFYRVFQQVGAYDFKENAEAKVKALKSAGHNAIIMEVQR